MLPLQDTIFNAFKTKSQISSRNMFSESLTCQTQDMARDYNIEAIILLLQSIQYTKIRESHL